MTTPMFVRSAAVAFTEAVERWPSSVIETIHAHLTPLYLREGSASNLLVHRKLTFFQAKLLTPEFDQFVRSRLSLKSQF